MSHFSTLKLELKSKDAIVDALSKLGFTARTFDEPHHLYGYRGDRRPQTADIVVERRQIGGLSNDLGFKWNEEEGSYDMLISDYDKSWGNCARGQGLGPTFVQNFSKEYTIAQIEQSGQFCVKEVRTLEDGSYQIDVETNQIHLGQSSGGW